MEIKNLMFLLCILFLYTAQSYAQQEVTQVYRMDARSPAEIFRAGGGGFFPRGTNDNIVEHIQDYSEVEHGPSAASAFISTTTDEEVAIEWGVNFQDGRPFYVYDIRPTFRFYSVVLTLQHLYAQTGNRDYLRLIRVYESQAEYVAVGGIAVTQIRGAQEFLYDERTGDYVSGRYITNNLYQQSATAANVSPYIQRAALPHHIIMPETYCALNSTSSHYSVHLTNGTGHDPFLKKLKQCHSSLLIASFLYAVSL